MPPSGSRSSAGTCASEGIGESLGRQPFGGARQQRQKRAAGRIRTTSAAIEVCRDLRSSEGMFEQADVLLRRAEQHGHLVEANASRGFSQDASRKLDTLACFAWR
jgi:hypothetical protein